MKLLLMVLAGWFLCRTILAILLLVNDNSTRLLTPRDLGAKAIVSLGFLLWIVYVLSQ